MKRTGNACALWLILLFAACIPASPPANFSATPGAAALSRETATRMTVFSVTYPTGWRVITSPAGAPPSVTFVQPGDCGLIVVSSVSLEQAPTSPSCSEPNIKTTTQTVTLGSAANHDRGERAERWLG